MNRSSYLPEQKPLMPESVGRRLYVTEMAELLMNAATQHIAEDYERLKTQGTSAYFAVNQAVDYKPAIAPNTAHAPRLAAIKNEDEVITQEQLAERARVHIDLAHEQQNREDDNYAIAA